MNRRVAPEHRATRYAIELALGEGTFGAEYVAHFLHERALAVGQLGAAEVRA